MTTRNRLQIITYWPPVESDGFGRKAYGEALLLEARWEDQTELVIDAQGAEQTSSAVVYPMEDLATGGVVALGDLRSVQNPVELLEARQIITTRRVSNLRATRQIFKASVR